MRNWQWILLLVALACAGLLVALTHQSSGHDFEGRCSECHLGMADPTMLVRHVNTLCLRCHRNRTIRSHPSDFIPDRNLPSRFPLRDGRMVCTTCHRPHRKMQQKGPSDIEADYPFLLRFPETGRPFCVQCHGPDVFKSNRDSHATSYGVAHRANPDPAILELLDDSSRDCLACHDGTISSNVDKDGAQWNHGAGIGLSHPVGVDYREAYHRKPGKYHPPSQLPEALQLINGRVECITCHDHYSDLPGLLVMDNEGSRMCLSCHNL